MLHPRSVRCVYAALVTVLVSALGIGCAGRLGPRAVEVTRNHYNAAGQKTTSEELLLNLVRLRYREPPYFLQIASLSTSMKVSTQVGANGTFPVGGGRAASVNGSLLAEESPTITYTPLVGDRFVRQLLQPIEHQTLLLLSHSGWSINRFLRLLVQEINGVPNAPTASGPTPDLAPEFDRFLRVAELFRALQARRQVSLVRGAGTADTGIAVRFSRAGLASAEYAELARLLSLAPGQEVFEMVEGLGAGDPTRIAIVTRSVLSALFYASHGVVVPADDSERGRVTVTRTADGAPFDWGQLTGTLLRVGSGGRPSDAYVAVRHRGTWFSIDDTDLDSKSTFSMLSLVLALQAGDLPSTGPILTLPVSR